MKHTLSTILSIIRGPGAIVLGLLSASLGVSGLTSCRIHPW